MRAISCLAALLCALLVAACGEGGSDGGNADPKPLKIMTTGLPAAQLGVAFPAAITATGGKEPYSWNVESGTLPPGLALSPGTPAMTFSGLPTTYGVYNFTVEVRDASFAVASADFTITVQPATPVTITTTTLPDAMQGNFYFEDVLTTGGTQAGYAWTVTTGTLPPGLGISANNLSGLIQGTPTVPGSYNFTVQVTDSIGATSSQALSMTVHDPLGMVTTNLPGGSMFTPYSQTIVASGGIGPGYTWTMPSGNLPPGLTFAGAGLTCTIQGSPSQSGFFVFTAQIEDSVGNTASLQYGINISYVAPLVISTASLPAGSHSVPYNAAVQAAGGTPPYTWSITSGVLPSGLNFQPGTPAALISGAPTTLGTWNFVVEVRDSQAVTAVQPLSIQVGAGQFGIANSPVLPIAVDGYDYVVKLHVVNSTSATHSWQVTGGTIPPGLGVWDGFGSVGLLSGVPTLPGNYTFTVSVTGTSVSAQATFSVEVRPKLGQLTVATQYLGECSQQFQLRTQLYAVGGTGTGYLWSVAPSSTLPNGLLLNNGVLIGRPTLPGPHTFTLQVTDSAMTVATREYTVETISGGPWRPGFGTLASTSEIRERGVFLLDASGSMAGSKIATVRAEMIATINALPAHYRFELIAFGDQFGVAASYSSPLWGTLLPATPVNQNSAVTWINGPALNPGGGSPAYAALKNTCATYLPSNLKYIAFVTSGYPNTSGSASQVLADFPQWWQPAGDCHLYSICVGGGGASFMQQLAALANATTSGTYIAI